MPISRFNLEPLDAALERNATILVPNTRIRDALLDSFAGRSDKNVYRTPQVSAVDIWIQETWNYAASAGIKPFCEKQILTPTQELAIWTSLIEKSLDQIPLLNPEETAAAVSQSYRDMKQWLLDAPDTSSLEAYDSIPDVTVFLMWVAQFRQLCQAKMTISLVDCTQLLIQHSNELEPAHSQELVLANFYQPPPLYEQLFETLPITERLYSAAPNEATVIPAVRYEFPVPEQELSACASWAKTLVDNDPDCHIGIIYDGSQQQRQDIERVVSDVLNPELQFDFTSNREIFNSTGSPHSLLQAALIHDAFLILGLANDQQQAEELCRLLRSPFLLDDSEEIEARIALERIMRRYLSAHCSVHEFAYLANQTDKPWHSPRLSAALLKFRNQLRLLPKTSDSQTWALTFSELLATMGWPVNTASAREQQLLTQWQEALDQFSLTGAVLPAVTRDTAVARLKQICSRIPQGRAFDSARNVSLYTVSEASGIQFDHVWLLGFDDASWPTATTASPFLPYSLQRDAGLPGTDASADLAAAAEAFAILKSSITGSLVASHHLYDGDEQFRLSSFVEELPLQKMNESVPQNPAALVRDSAHKLTVTSDPPLLAVTEEESVRGGHAIISDQSACPFRAFVSHRLKTQPLQEFVSGLSPMAKGSAIHEALEFLYSNIDKQSDLNQLSEQQLYEHCHVAAQQAIDYLTRRYPNLMTPRYRSIEHQRIRSLLINFLNREKERGDFQVLARELRQSWQSHGLTLDLVIDRIDQLDDGSLAVIDYKTGKRALSRLSWLDERPQDMQLPVYYLVNAEQQDKPVHTLSIAHVNAEKSGYSGLSAEANFHSSLKPIEDDSRLNLNWQQLTEDFEQKVQSFAAEFSAGVTTVNPSHGAQTCQYCGFQSLCRIQGLDKEDPDFLDGGLSE